MSVRTQPRKPAGSTEGGQFAHAGGAESNLDPLPHLTCQPPCETCGATPSQLSDAELLEIANRAVRQALRRRHHMGAGSQGVHNGEHLIEIEDLASEVVAQYLEANPREVRTAPTNYVVGIAKNVVAKALPSKLSSRADQYARAEFYRLVESNEAKLGRSLTASERDWLAASIIDNWDDSARHVGTPTPGFHRGRPTVVYLDASEYDTLPAGDSATGRTPTIRDGEPDYFEEAQKCLDTGGHAAHRRSRAYAWNVVAQAMDLPRAQRATVTARQAAAYRAAISQHPGGIDAVIRTWEAGDDTAETEGLFAPFGGSHMSDSDRRKVVNQLKAASPWMRYELWDSAVKFAHVRFDDGGQR